MGRFAPWAFFIAATLAVSRRSGIAMSVLPQNVTPARRTPAGESEPPPERGLPRPQAKSGLTESERAWLLGQMPPGPPTHTVPRESTARRYRAVLSCISCPESTPEGGA